MFGIGLPELILIMALALIVVGPDKLPDLAYSIARQILELKKTAQSLKESLQDELYDEDQDGKRTPSTRMEEKPLLDIYDSAEDTSHYPSLKEDAAADLTPLDPESFNVSREKEPSEDKFESGHEGKDTGDKDSGEKS